MKTIVILHGWGASSKSFYEVKDLLEKEGFNVQVPNLPGFGEESSTKKIMDFDDYITFVKDFIKNRKVILLGHSFGGKIAIKLASQNPEIIEKLILTGASGVRRGLNLKRKIAYILAKVGKKILPIGQDFFKRIIYYWIGEWDYYKSGKLLETFKRVYSIDIKNYLPEIKVQTLIIWGERDNVVPVSDARYIKEKIRKSRLIIIPGAAHNLPYGMPNVFVEKILPFLKDA